MAKKTCKNPICRKKAKSNKSEFCSSDCFNNYRRDRKINRSFNNRK